MKSISKILQGFMLTALLCVTIMSCQKKERPAMSAYPPDVTTPDGPLKFYVAFDGTTSDPLRNAVDSVRANFASDNPLTSIDGVRGKAIKGENKKYVKYIKPNDWASKSKSFTISFWYRRDGQTKNNSGTNGPEYPISFKSSNGHWSGSNMFVILEGNNAGCAVKVMIADKAMADNWFTWENADVIPGMLDNKWHHVALVYDAATSGLTFYLDGIADARVRKWGTHGDINIDESAISEVKIGAGPGTNYDSDDWLSSTWKGDLDEFRMYSQALTAAEVTTLFVNKK
jgi:hypothetical protein